MINFYYNQRFTRGCITHISDSARHQSEDISPPIFQIVLKNFIKISLIVKNVLKISNSSWNTVIWFIFLQIGMISYSMLLNIKKLSDTKKI